MLSNAISNGIVLSGINFIVSVIVALLAYKKIFKNFNNTVLLSLLIRYLIVASLVWYGLSNYNKYEAREFGISFMISTFVFILSEIIIFHLSSKKFSTQNIDKC